jgi:hypothetical protein
MSENKENYNFNSVNWISNNTLINYSKYKKDGFGL